MKNGGLKSQSEPICEPSDYTILLCQTASLIPQLTYKRDTLQPCSANATDGKPICRIGNCRCAIDQNIAPSQSTGSSQLITTGKAELSRLLHGYDVRKL